MRKTILFAVLAVLTVATAASAASPVVSRPYLSGNLGLVSMGDFNIKGDGTDVDLSQDIGFAMSIAFGYTSSIGLRPEIEFSYRHNEIDEADYGSLGKEGQDGNFGAWSVMGNMYYDFLPESTVTPFVMAGAGMTFVSFDAADFGSYDESVFSYQAGIGLSYAFSRYVRIEGQYRYLATEDADFDDLVWAEDFDAYTAHTFLFGLRISF